MRNVNFLFLVILLVMFALLAVWLDAKVQSWHKDCESMGGVLIRDGGYRCIKAEILKKE